MRSSLVGIKMNAPGNYWGLFVYRLKSATLKLIVYALKVNTGLNRATTPTISAST